MRFDQAMFLLLETSFYFSDILDSSGKKIRVVEISKFLQFKIIQKSLFNMISKWG